MMTEQQMVGGAAVGVLDRLERWESWIVMNLRLWCDGPDGREQVWDEYKTSLPFKSAENECRAFEKLLHTILSAAHRPLVRHDVGCSCLGADESVFLHLTRTAAQGHHRDAALIATLLAGAGHAENIALLAGQVGCCARKINASAMDYAPRVATNAMRLH